MGGHIGQSAALSKAACATAPLGCGGQVAALRGHPAQVAPALRHPILKPDLVQDGQAAPNMILGLDKLASIQCDVAQGLPSIADAQTVAQLLDKGLIPME